MIQRENVHKNGIIMTRKRGLSCVDDFADLNGVMMMFTVGDGYSRVYITCAKLVIRSRTIPSKLNVSGKIFFKCS